MKVLVCESPGVLTYADQKKPVFQKGEALVRIHKVGICGTDLHAFEGVQPYFEYPRILGHELAAEFIDGDGAGFAPGDRVSILPYLSCDSCVACKANKPNCCVNMKVCGVHRDGGMVEYLTIPFNSLIHGEGLSFDQLALVEPLAIGAHALRSAKLQAGEFVVVIGAGPIGLGIIEFATMQGGVVIAIDVNDSRLDFCRKNLNTTFTINPLKENVHEQLKAVTAGEMPTLVIDATGNRNAINEGFQWMAHGGRFVLVGLQRNDISFSHPEFHKREGMLMSSRNATKADFDYVIQNIKHNRVDVTKFITHTLSFDDVGAGFSALLDPAHGVVKAVITVVEDV